MIIRCYRHAAEYHCIPRITEKILPGDLRPLTVLCNRIPQHLKIYPIALAGIYTNWPLKGWWWWGIDSRLNYREILDVGPVVDGRIDMKPIKNNTLS